MKIQNCSVCVPSFCFNDCFFCCAKMGHNDKGLYPFLKDRVRASEFNNEIRDRFIYLSMRQCESIVFTGTGDPIQNIPYIYDIIKINEKLIAPITNIEVQTCGVGLDEEIITRLKRFGVKTIALSISSLDNKGNAYINQTPKGKEVDIPNVCNLIKKHDLNLRISINMNNIIDKWVCKTKCDCSSLFKKLNEWGANQVKFTKLEITIESSKQAKWIHENTNDEIIETIKKYIIKEGNKLWILPFGKYKYSLNGISCVVDDDCMAKNNENIRSVILRENGKLYGRWHDQGSLIF